MKKFVFSLSDNSIALGIGITLFVLLHLIFPIYTNYDYYTRLSLAFSQGMLCLADNPPWLNELVPIPAHGFCVVYPIAPALLFLPFVSVLPTFSQTTGAHLFFGLAGSIIYLLFRRRKASKGSALLFSLSWCLGTIFFSMSAVGSAWYVAQTIGSVCILASLLTFDHNTKWKLVLSGIFFGLAATSRLPLHLYALYFLLHTFTLVHGSWKKWALTLCIFGIGFLPPFLTQRFYNYARYTTFADSGYYLIPGKFEEEDFKNGEFNLRNIPKHLEVFLFGMPKEREQFPYIVPSYYGLSIFLTSPFFLFAIFSLCKKEKIPEAITILAILILEMSHGTVGFTQFGYRFALDVYPLFFLAFDPHLFAKKKSAILFVLLLLFAIIVNFWGLLAFRYEWFIW